jgi:hypothetical protein
MNALQTIAVIVLCYFVPGTLFAAYTDYDFGGTRYGSFPGYRYYDKFSTPGPTAAQAYVANENERVANYWESKYYGTVEPTAQEQYDINRALLDIM